MKMSFSNNLTINYVFSFAHVESMNKVSVDTHIEVKIGIWCSGMSKLS